jgi:diguanylate cyclase (GGDEF)-like protein
VPRRANLRRCLGLIAGLATFAAALASAGSETRRLEVGSLGLTLVSLVSVLAAVRAAIRTRRRSRRIAQGWLFVAAAFLSLAINFALSYGYETSSGAVPFPSAVDGFVLAFYPLFLLGCSRFAPGRLPRVLRARTVLDTLVVGASTASVLWFLTLGPTIEAGGPGWLAETVSTAYPIGDTVQLYCLIYLWLKARSSSERRTFALLGAGVVTAVFGNVVFSWLALHDRMGLQWIAQLAWFAGACLYTLAASTQNGRRPASAERAPETDRAPAAAPTEPRPVQPAANSWLVYTAPVLLFVLLVIAQVQGGVMIRLGLAIQAALVVVLVSVRQYLTQVDLRATHDELRLAHEELAHRTEQLHHQALHDALTGLPNRILVTDRVDAMLRDRVSGRPGGAVMFVDLDGFKDVNDTLGHEAGDELLKVVAARMAEVLDSSATLGRMGGDEFVVVVDAPAVANIVETVARQVIETVRRPISLGTSNVRARVTASIGIAFGWRASCGELLRDADIALYRAKDEGRDRYVVFRPDLDGPATSVLPGLGATLRDALAAG